MRDITTVEKNREQKGIILIWIEDILWSEALKRETAVRGILIQEADSEESFMREFRQHGRYSIAILDGKKWRQGGDWRQQLEALCRQGAIPVWVLWNASEEELLDAYEAGVADCITVEESIRIVTAKLFSAVRRGTLYAAQGGFRASLTEDIRNRTILAGDDRIALTGYEFRVFHLLNSSFGNVVGREEIYQKVWFKNKPDSRRAVDTIIRQLRRKLGDTSYEIRTKYGDGYLLQAKDGQ